MEWASCTLCMISLLLESIAVVTEISRRSIIFNSLRLKDEHWLRGKFADVASSCRKNSIWGQSAHFHQQRSSTWNCFTTGLPRRIGKR